MKNKPKQAFKIIAKKDGHVWFLTRKIEFKWQGKDFETNWVRSYKQDTFIIFYACDYNGVDLCPAIMDGSPMGDGCRESLFFYVNGYTPKDMLPTKVIEESSCQN